VSDSININIRYSRRSRISSIRFCPHRQWWQGLLFAGMHPQEITPLQNYCMRNVVQLD